MRNQGVVLPVLVLAVAALVALLPGTAVAKPPGDEPCKGQKSFGWMGDWETDAVTFPSLTNPNGVQNYKGIMRRPRNAIEFPGKRPVVFLQHGVNGNECSLSWIARDLAGHGYVTVVWQSPKENAYEKSFANALDGMRSAVSFARGPSNPFLTVSDNTRTALGGHSMGSIVASALHYGQAVQKAPGLPAADFAGGGSKAQYRRLSHYTRAWLQRWVRDEKSAVQQLLAKTVEGQPTQNLLSTQFFSGAYLPGVVNVTNFRDYVQRDHSIPNTKKTGGPDDGRKVKKRKLARTGVSFRFRVEKPEPGTRFQCRLDKQNWRTCTPPKKLEKRLSKGKHSFRARAIDAAGNKETKPALWEFRVVK